MFKDIDFLLAWEMMDFENYDIAVSKKKLTAYMLPIRGCSNYCTFCSNAMWKLEKPWSKMLSPKNFAQEVNYLYGRGIREIYLRSDAFTLTLSGVLKSATKSKS